MLRVCAIAPTVERNYKNNMTKSFVHSHSALELFELCPKKFEGERITKEFPYKDDEKSLWGKDAHKALEKAILFGQPLADRFSSLQWVLNSLEKVKGTKYAEMRLAVNKNREPVDFFADDVYYRGVGDIIIDCSKKVFCGDYKGLPLETKLPTPAGWTTMEEVQIGDQLIDKVGVPCTVIGKSKVKNLPCYQITFDDTSVVECDNEHLWVLHNGAVLPVQSLQINDLILVAEPFQLSRKELPLDPYVLGMWLADGKHTSAEITKPDEGIWEEIQRRGYQIGHDYSVKANNGKCRIHTVLGIRGILSSLNVLGNKHIPIEYMRASYEQRLDLLRGLFDGDGSANITRKEAVLNTVNLDFAQQIKELLLSLGQRPLLSPYIAHGFGKYVQAYFVKFRPNGINPFLLARKADKILPSWGSGYAWRRRIKSIEEIPSKATQCVLVDSSDHTFLCTENCIPTHNTGKKKYNNLDLARMAVLLFAKFPEAEEILSAFIWFQTKDTTLVRYKREEVDAIWEKIIEEATTVEWAIANNRFPAHDNFLCRNYCPVTTCMYNGRSR